MRIFEYPIDISRTPGIYGPNAFNLVMPKGAKIISTDWHKNSTVLIYAVVEPEDWDSEEITLAVQEIFIYGLGQEIPLIQNKKFIGRISTNLGKGSWFIFENKKET